MQAEQIQEVTQEKENGENTPNLVQTLPARLQEALPGLGPDDAALIAAVAWKLALWRNIGGTADHMDQLGLELTRSQRGEAPRRLMRMVHHLNKADVAAGKMVPDWIPVSDES